jgi:hypothetical protein
MPEREARPPAENRHGGAPRGERVPLDARRASQAWLVAPDSATNEILRLSALRPPLIRGRMEREKQNPGAETRRGNEETALFDIVNRERREPRRRSPDEAKAKSGIRAARHDRPAFRSRSMRATGCGLRGESRPRQRTRSQPRARLAAPVREEPLYDTSSRLGAPSSSSSSLTGTA